jgi:DNA-binding CsgD family transcriptional regulator
MFVPQNKKYAKVDSKTYPLGENAAQPNGGSAMALLALSHTPIEHRLYLAMLKADGGDAPAGSFTARQLLTLTGIRSLSTIRRGLDGLIAKLSVERQVAGGSDGKASRNGNNGNTYRVFSPAEIVGRRKEIGLASYANGFEASRLNQSFDRALGRIVENRNLSRREAQVALCCVEGLTNAEIGQRLEVSEQTVKFHLRHVFIKFGVKRRAELISRLLM